MRLRQIEHRVSDAKIDPESWHRLRVSRDSSKLVVADSLNTPLSIRHFMLSQRRPFDDNTDISVTKLRGDVICSSGLCCSTSAVQYHRLDPDRGVLPLERLATTISVDPSRRKSSPYFWRCSIVATFLQPSRDT